MAYKIPVEVLRPLLDVVNNITELCRCSAHRHVMLSTDELKLKYGNIVRKEHKVALNQLTTILNREQTNVDITGPTFQHSAAFSEIERVIKRPEILSDIYWPEHRTPPIPQYERRGVQHTAASAVISSTC